MCPEIIFNTLYMLRVFSYFKFLFIHFLDYPPGAQAEKNTGSQPERTMDRYILDSESISEGFIHKKTHYNEHGQPPRKNSIP